METDKETLKIRKMQELLGRRLIEGLETVYFPFEELLREPEFKDINGIKTTLSLIQQGSGGRITWDVRLKDRFLPAPTGAAITEYVAPIPLSPVPVGVDVHVSDPAKMDKYFDGLTKNPKSPKKNNQIESIEITRREDDSKAIIMVNGQASGDEIRVDIGKKLWGALVQVIEDGSAYSEKARSIADYFNKNKRCPLYKHGHDLTEILIASDDHLSIAPRVKIKIVGPKTLARRKNKHT